MASRSIASGNRSTAHGTERVDRGARTLLGRASSALVSIFAAPVVLVLWLQSRAQSDYFDTGLTEDLGRLPLVVALEAARVDLNMSKALNPNSLLITNAVSDIGRFPEPYADGS